MTVRIETFRGAEIARFLPALAGLRIEVFREWPYLYDGSMEEEQKYLTGYATPGAMVAIAFDGDELVGAATALPLLAHAEAVAPPLAAAGFDPAEVYYFGESVLRRDRRGRGIGHRFFDAREAEARRQGYPLAAFCAVERPPQRRPADYVPHDAFWTKRGFVRRPDIVGRIAWTDVGDEVETEKPMVFWIKRLEPGA